MALLHAYSLLVAALLVIACPFAARGESCQVDAIPFTTTDVLGPFYVEASAMTSIIAPRKLLIDPVDVFTVHGTVFGSNCVPLVKARVETWYAGEGDDGAGGIYLTDGFRGQVMTDECGSFLFTQTFPAVYAARPIPHIHYRISSANKTELLVTQLYFEGVIVPGVGTPDATKTSSIGYEADGSRSSKFNIYVGIPGTADMNACKTSSPGSSRPPGSTMRPSNRPSLLPNQAGPKCGSVFCGLGLECCNASCSACTVPGGVCQQIACVSKTPPGTATVTVTATAGGNKNTPGPA